ncbi:hypothetical protein acdb102_33130 [Acidothermaceae bacterium B102]|nr:hypothetical protein acdb102_33130 [Acidothermaceae bacterium B102]
MAKDRGPWNEGRRAWERLNGWHHDGPTHADSGDGALTALADVGLIRQLLGQAELVAVRTARRHGKSWAEIATQLGVTRQSAWERWRDLDETPAADSGKAKVTVRVPTVVGLKWDDARHALQELGLVAVGPDPDGPPLAAFGWPDGVVTDQAPDAGAWLTRGSSVTLWLNRGGGAGVREPRRPKPTPRPARAMRAEPSDEAVG